MDSLYEKLAKRNLALLAAMGVQDATSCGPKVRKGREGRKGGRRGRGGGEGRKRWGEMRAMHEKAGEGGGHTGRREGETCVVLISGVWLERGGSESVEEGNAIPH